MTSEEFKIVDDLNTRKEELEGELVFILRPETKRYPIVELSYREFDYNVYSEEILTTVYNLLNDELTIVQNEMDNIICSGSL